MSQGEERGTAEGTGTAVEEEMMLTGVTSEEGLRIETTVGEEGKTGMTDEVVIEVVIGVVIGEAIEVAIGEVLVPGLLELAGTNVKRKLMLDLGEEDPLHPHPVVTALDPVLVDVTNHVPEAVMKDVTIPALDVTTADRRPHAERLKNVLHAESRKNVPHVQKLRERMTALLCVGS